MHLKDSCVGLPQWLSSKESACSAGDEVSTPGLGRPGGGHGNPPILAWRIPWTEETSRLWYKGLQRVRRDWSDWAHSHIGKVPRWHAGILAQVQWEFEVCLRIEKKFWKILTSESLLLRTTLHSSSLRLSAVYVYCNFGKKTVFPTTMEFH